MVITGWQIIYDSFHMSRSAAVKNVRSSGSLVLISAFCTLSIFWKKNEREEKDEGENRKQPWYSDHPMLEREFGSVKKKKESFLALVKFHHVHMSLYCT